MRIKIGKNKYWNPLILLKNILVLILILLVVWMSISYLEIVIKNVHVHPVYWDYNFWMLFE